MVKDKINYRARGPRNVLTRQTVQGRANDGGLRIGEMERDGILAHGASYFLTESYMERGDVYYMAICNKSGAIAVFNKALNIFYSPFVDGPIHFTKDTAGLPILDVFSKYGRSFSIVRIPYSLKLLIQELQVMNIQMRIITEKNIDQLMNMSYQSKNLERLIEYHGSETIQARLKDLIEKETTSPEVDLSTERELFIKLYKREMKAKVHETPLIQEPEVPEVVEEDVPVIEVGSEVVLINDNVVNRKWNVMKILGNDVLIQTSDISEVPTYGKFNKTRDRVIVATDLRAIAPYVENTPIEDSPPSDNTPQSEIFHLSASPNTASNVSSNSGQISDQYPSPIYAPNSSPSIASNVSSNNGQNSAPNSETNSQVNMGQSQPTLDFENTNYISKTTSTPNTSSDKSENDKLDILTMDKEEEKPEEKKEESETNQSEKKVVNLT